MICIFGLVLGRTLYSIGYCKGGPKGRVPGAMIQALSLLGVIIGAFVSIFTWDMENTRILPISQAKYDALVGVPA